LAHYIIYSAPGISLVMSVSLSVGAY